MRFDLLSLFACALATQAADFQVVFEVASVKRADAGDHYTRVVGGPGTNDPTRVFIENYPLSSLVKMAYDISNYQLSGPDWLDEERFTVTAKLPEMTTKEQFRLMMRNLLIDRFRLAAHFEQRQAQGYRLIVAKGRPKLTVSAGDPERASDLAKPPAPFKLTTDREGYPEPPPDRRYFMAIAGDKARWRFIDESMEQFTSALAEQIHQPVLNATGLEGKYDLEIYWSYAAERPDTLPDSGPSIFNALQEQLGLKLVSEKIPVQTLVVDHIDKMPTEN